MLPKGVERSLLLLTIALAVSANYQLVQSQERQLVAPNGEKNPTYDDSRSSRRNDENIKSNVTSETLETAPSITSVHQVWTSSSSGRLDELSPEIISKLRNDVPFLAAYALRPRLVGASAAPLIAHLQAAAPEASAGGARLDVAASSQGDPKVALATASSARQLDGRALSKLGDFSEYNEETSSLSKSEHSHRRKTSVRRAQPETGDGPLEFSSSSLRRRRVSSSGRNDKSGDSLKQLVSKLKQRSSSGKSRTSKANSLKKSASRGKRAGKANRRRGSKNSRAREAKVSKTKTSKRRASKSGRLLQDSQSKVNDERATGGAGDVKGGGPVGAAKKPPFYASTRPDAKEGKGTTVEPPTDSIDENKLDNSGSKPEDRAEIDEEPREVELKRVGDDDVEEDIGDTVLVEPKSDGVDDDPPLPDSLPDDDADDDAQEQDTDGPQDGKKAGGESPGDDKADGEEGTRTRGSDSDVATPMPKLAPEGDPRGNRVNRHKPNQQPLDNTDSTSDDDNSSGGTGASGDGGGGSQVAGGGIGTTLGGGAGSRGGSGAGSDDDNQSGGDGGSSGRGGSAGVTPGVEFASGDREDEERDSRGERGEKSVGGSATGADGGSLKPAGSSGDGQFGDRRQGSQGGVGSSNGGRGGSGKDEGEGEDDDLDYRDEMVGAERKNTGGTLVPTSGSGDGARGEHGKSGGSKSTSDESVGHEGATKSRPATGGGDHITGHGHGHHCDDGSYNHHHDGHGGHHSHHDTIDWLRGAIPGEPDDDYPILSRVNVTNFKCADQKHPGYYADVDARCQIFHICQADGRQDSFLCPNGTIFSQRTLVCVWWNGFQCEDAPKYYHLNELLYKTTNGNESPQAAALPQANSMASRGSSFMRPLMTPLRPNGMRTSEDHDDNDEDDRMVAALAPGDDDGDDTSPIDGLVRAMRGRGGGGESATARDATGNAIGGTAVSREQEEERAAGGGGVSPRGHSDAAPGRRNLGDDADEATIQRKSTNLDDDDADADEPPARLRARDNIRRRRRRASTRQAPPKLKSRRVSRNSRRRKLRHGVKPRRRA